VPEENDGRDSVRRFAEGAKLGAAAALTVTAAIAVAGKLENGDAWEPFNDVSHVLLGEEKSDCNGFNPQTSLLGLALNAAAMQFWAIPYRWIFGTPGFPRSALTASAAAAIIYLIDYHLLPKRLAPGFERRLSGGSILCIYAVALTFLLAHPSSTHPSN
jgi:hypothetical protein